MKKTFRLVAFLLIPFAAILLLELSLRLFTNSNQLFITCKENPNFLELNNNFRDAKLNISNAKQNWLQRLKGNKTIRVFVVQQATQLSFPKNPNSDFSHLLRFYLQNSYPDKNFELINIPLTSASSYSQYEIARQLPEYLPDLVILFPGMDEYYGQGTIGSGSYFSGSTNLYRLARRLEIFKLLLPNNPKHIQDVSPEKQISLHNNTLKHFETNLEDMVASLQNSHIPVMIVGTASNIQDQPPADSFAVENYPPILKRQFDEGKEAFQKGDLDNAIRNFSNVYRKDKSNASVCFYLGKIALKDNNFPLTEQYFRKAIELDRLKTRPGPDINKIIFKVAVTKGCSLIEAEKSFAEFTRLGFPGKNLFHGPIEKRLLANALTARECFNKIIDGKILKQDSIYQPNLNRTLPITPFDTAYDLFIANNIEKNLDYSLLDLNVKGDGTNELYEEKTATMFLMGKKSWEDSMNNLYQYYLRNKNYPLALKVIENLAIEYPYNPKILEMVSDTASYLGNPQLVIYYAQRAYVLKPTYKTAKLLFLNFLTLDKPERALPYIIFARNKKPCPDDLALIYSATNQIIDLKKILTKKPTDIALQKMIGKQYLAMGNTIAASQYGFAIN